MAEESQGTPKQATDWLRDLSMEMRLLIAFGLMGLVLLGTQYLMPKPPPPPKQPQQQAQKQEQPPSAPTPAPATKPGEPAPTAALPASIPATTAAHEETHVIETDVYKVVFSNKGAVVRSWILKKYKDLNGKPVELVSAAAAPKAGWPFAYVFPRQKPATDLNRVLFAVTATPLSVDFAYSDGATSARKTFRFDQKTYLAQFSSEVNSAGQGLDHQIAWRGGFGDHTAHNANETQKSVHYDSTKQKLVEEASGVADKGPVAVSGSFQFAGIEDNFFAGVLMPTGGRQLEFATWNDRYSAKQGEDEKPHVGASFGGGALIAGNLFVGPKDTDVLRATDRKLETMIDWGWFWFIAKPLFLALHWINDNLTGSWGWAIVLATVIINLLMLPMRFSQLRSSQKMGALQPELQAIQAKYKGMSMKDPRKQKQNEEMMALYQKHGINPMGGCVPLLLQMPFFIAFFKVLSVAIELRGAAWLWVSDLSQPETLPIRMLPVGMLVTQVLMQKLTPAASPDPSQQRLMMIMMPIMLTVMFYGASSGLVLYWLTGNVVGIVQQYFFNKIAAGPAPAQTTATKKK